MTTRALVLEALATGPASVDALTWVALRMAEHRTPREWVSHQAVDAVLRRMSAEGLVSRHPVPGSRSLVYLLTPAGRRARREVLNHAREARRLAAMANEQAYGRRWLAMRDQMDTQPVADLPGWLAWRQSGMLQLVRPEPWARTSSVHMAGWNLGPDDVPQMLLDQAARADHVIDHPEAAPWPYRA